MVEKDFWQLYDAFMSADLTFSERQVFYFAAKMRYMGARYEKNGKSLERVKPGQFQDMQFCADCGKQLDPGVVGLCEKCSNHQYGG
jgi:hypothetical protein